MGLATAAGSTTLIRVDDRHGAPIMSLHRDQFRHFYVRSAAGKRDLMFGTDVVWAEDDLGRPRAGVRRHDSGFKVLDRAGDVQQFISHHDQVWRVEKPDGELYAVVRPKGTDLVIYNEAGKIEATVVSRHHQVVVLDAGGEVLYRMTHLEPAGGALWFLYRGDPRVASALLGALFAW